MTETALDRTADTTPDFAVMFEELRKRILEDKARAFDKTNKDSLEALLKTGVQAELHI